LTYLRLYYITQIILLNRASNNSRNRRIMSFTYIMRPLNSRFDSAGRQKAKLMHNQWSGIETRRSRAINATVVTPLLRMSIARLTIPNRVDQTWLSLLINLFVRRLKKLVLSSAITLVRLNNFLSRRENPIFHTEA